MSWFYHENGENKGPVTVEDLRQLRQNNRIADDTLVWQEGLPQWVAFSASNVGTQPGFAVVTPNAAASANLLSCSECGKVFPESDMISYEGKWICPSCKPLFFQRLREGVNQPGVFQYARVLTRFVAVFLDGILLDIVVIVPVAMLIGFVMAASSSSTDRAGVSLAGGLFIDLAIIFIPALYEIIMIGRYGQTLGKMALKVKVVSDDGGPVGYGKSTGRYFSKILSSLIFGIGYLMAIWDPEKRALHDRICGTRVVAISF